MNPTPGEIVSWLVAGLAVGWVAGKLCRSSFGLIGDLAVGLIGALVGGLAGKLVATGSSVELAASIILALAGAATLIVVIRLPGGRRQTV